MADAAEAWASTARPRKKGVVLGVSGSSDQMELALGWNSFSLERLLSWKYNFILSRTEFWCYHCWNLLLTGLHFCVLFCSFFLLLASFLSLSLLCSSSSLSFALLLLFCLSFCSFSVPFSSTSIFLFIQSSSLLFNLLSFLSVPLLPSCFTSASYLRLFLSLFFCSFPLFLSSFLFYLSFVPFLSVPLLVSFCLPFALPFLFFFLWRSGSVKCWKKGWGLSPGEGTLLLEWQLRRYWDSARAISGQCALGAPRRNGDEMVRRESQLLKHKWCSMQVGWRSMWPRYFRRFLGDISWLGSKRPGTWAKACCNRLLQQEVVGSKTLW